MWELPATTLPGAPRRRSGDCIHEGHCYGVTEWNPDRFHSREERGSSLMGSLVGVWMDGLQRGAELLTFSSLHRGADKRS